MTTVRYSISLETVMILSETLCDLWKRVKLMNQQLESRVLWFIM
jgi:hypothetical protein